MSESLMAPGETTDQLQTGGRAVEIEINNQAIQLTVQQNDVNQLVPPQELPADLPALERRGVDEARAALPETLVRYALEEDQAAFNQYCERARVTGNLGAAYVQLRDAALGNRSDIYAGRARDLRRDGHVAEAEEAVTQAGRDNYDRAQLQPEATREQQYEAGQLRVLELATEGLSDEQRTDALRGAAGSGYFSASVILRLQSEWGLNQQEDEQAPSIQVPMGADGSFEQPIMFAIQEHMRRQLDDIRTMQQGGKSPAEVRQSEAYQRLASMAGARRAEQAMATLARGKTAQEAATEATTNIYTRHLLDAGNLHVVPVRRQQGG